MLGVMLGEAGVPCDLALVRSPEQFVAKNPDAPRIRPGIYVGDYGHGMYGQFRTEVLLVEYLELSPREMQVEVDGPASLFGRPDPTETAPDELQRILELDTAATFIKGTKQCGDVHVPMGATTFVALCGPPEACSALAAAHEAPSVVLNRQTGQMERVLCAWRGWGTLAMFGFRGPSWAGGWLVRLQDGGTTEDHRFGFVWDRDQDAIVLHWVVTQDMCPFLQRAWLPEDLR